MNWIQRQQSLLSRLATLLAFFVLAIGASWRGSFIYLALVEEHPVRILTTLLLIVSLSWLTDLTVDQEGSHTRAVAWFLLDSLLTMGLVAYLIWTGIDWKGHLLDTHIDWRSVLLFSVIGALFIFKSLPGPVSKKEPSGDVSNEREAERTTDALYERWGEVASLVIMILALFAFGLRYNDKQELDMHWAEVPAILVVFVLAELGVHLVVNSRRIARTVRNSAELAEKAVNAAAGLTKQVTEESGNLRTTMDELNTKGQRLVNQLDDTSKSGKERLDALEAKFQNLFDMIAPVIETNCYESSARLYDQLGMDKKVYWNQIGIFANSWNPDAQGKEGTKRLLNVLFSAYIGDKADTGSVRQKGSSVSCITADAVFAEASERWLEEMRRHSGKEKPLVVWAVTRLLPTEFAFPLVWLGTDDPAEKASRVNALERFVYSVIDTCKGKGSEVEYRRVTVFDEWKDFEAFTTPRNVSEWLVAGTPHDISLDKTQETLMSNTLDNWLLWDPRVQDHEWFNKGDQMFAATDRLLRSLLKADGKPDAINSEKNLRWSNLEPLCNDQVKSLFGEKHRSRMLPFFPSGSKEAILFQSDFAIPRNVNGVVGTNDGNVSARGIVLGSSRRFLDRQPVLAELKDVNIPEDLRTRIVQAFQGNVPDTRSLLAAIGWRTLKDWYCESLHAKGPSGYEAWYAAMSNKEEDKAFLKGFLMPLQLDWNGASFLTLDLLLIGSRDPGKEHVDWHGAAISNLSFERTECTVQLVTRVDRLKDIEGVVDGLCHGKAGADCGPWQDWKGRKTDVAVAAG